MDAKDILGLPRTPLVSSQERKSQSKKETHRKPEGVSREVYALTGGLAPLVPSVDTLQLKKRQLVEEKVTWRWLPFTSSARKDDLKLYHWVRVVNGVPPTGDYAFAKYNKSVDIIKYTDEEYEKYLTDPFWSKDETDQLFDLCERFDLHFVVIADRISSSRTVEELKDRYYSASRAILIARAPSPADVSEHPLVKNPYNISQDKERKRVLSVIFSQSKYQERRDAEVLAEAKRISESRLAGRVGKKSQSAVSSSIGSEINKVAIGCGDTVSPSSNAPLASSSTTIDDASTLASLHVLKVYLRSYALEQMVYAASSSEGLRTIKHMEQILDDLGVSFRPRVPTKAVCSEHLELRKEIFTFLNLQKQLQYKEADGSFSEMPDTPKSYWGQDHTFVPDTMSGRRDQKCKGPGRSSEEPLTTGHKRPRKYRATDV